MKTPAALPRLALGPLLLATALGATGFAAGWAFRADVDAIPSVPPPPLATAAVATDGALRTTTTGGAPHAPPATAAGAPALIAPAAARQRLEAWVAAGCPRGDPREVLRLVEAWSAAEPWQALTFIHGAAQFRGRTEAYRIPLARIAAADAAQAIEWLKQELDDPGLRAPVADGMIRALMEDHPAAAVRIADAFTWSQSWIASQAFEQLARRDPDAARAWFERASPEDRLVRAGRLAEGWLRADFESAQAWCLAQVGQPHGDSVLRALAFHAAEHDPARLGSLFALPALPMAVRASVIRQLGNTHPDVALDLLPTLPGDQAPGLFTCMFSNLFAEDPGSAVELGRSMLEPDVLACRVREEWVRWAETDRPAALAWAAGLTDPVLSDPIAHVLRRREVGREPAAYLATLTAAPEDRATRELVSDAIEALAHKDPDAAAAWYASRSAIAPPDEACTVARMLLFKDAARALAWARELPAGRARDLAHATVIEERIEARRPEQLAPLVDEIGDPVLQMQVRFRIFNRMREANPAAAQHWLEAQPLSADVRVSWLALADEDAGLALTRGY